MATRQEKIDTILQERPYVAQVVQAQILNDIAGILFEQLAVTKDAIPDLMRKYQFSITSKILELNSDRLPSMPWISIEVYNSGADPVHLYINDYGIESIFYLDQTPTDPTIDAGDTFVLDMKSSNIKKIYLVCDQGDTTTVRIYATMKDYRSHPREEAKL